MAAALSARKEPARLSMSVVVMLCAIAASVVNDGYGDNVLVPSGTFRMDDDHNEGWARERPVHAVHVDAFYIARVEMSNGEWRKFRDDPGYDDDER